MTAAFVLLNVFVVLMTARLRYAGPSLQYASPVPAPPWLWTAAIIASAVGAVGAAIIGRKALRDRCAAVAMLQMMIFPLALAYIWAILPELTEDYRPVEYIALAAMVLVVAAMFWFDRRNASQWGLTGKNFAPAAKLLAPPTAVMIATPFIVGAIFGYQFSAGPLAVALASYPLYALAQLLIFQVFLVTRLRRITNSPAAVITASACMFALLHWPNAALMAPCGICAAVWTAIYLKRPNVYALAISMGLSAAVLMNILPNEKLLQHARTGPIYARRLIDANPNILKSLEQSLP